MQRKSIWFTILGALALWGLYSIGWANAPQDKQKTAKQADRIPGGALRLISAQGKELGNCPLKQTEVTADISGFVARVQVKQQFSNTASEPVEAIYTFPLPADAAVDDMTMIIGQRRIVGKIKKREEARKIYEAAKSAGKSAGLLNQERPNIFTQVVANIMPGQDITISISYVNMLKYDEGKYEFVFPSVVGPRYVPGGGHYAPGLRGAPMPGEAPDDSGTTDSERITPPIAPEGTRAGHDISININLDAGVPLKWVKSVLHPVDVTGQGLTRVKIRLRNESTLPNKDFILRYAVADNKIQTGVLAYAPSGKDGYFTLILQPPVAPPLEEVAPKEMIFVIDQTGSQSGWPIQKSKEVMRYCIQHLNPQDTFQLIGFNTGVYPCFQTPVRVTKANIAKALRYLEPIEGGGGTDILGSVDYVLKQPSDPARPRIVCYMTDGYVNNDIEIINYIRKHRGQTRMFPFGIGNSINRFLVDGMAREGRGVAEVVTLNILQKDQSADVEETQDDESDAASGEKKPRAASIAARFHKRVANPLLLDVKIDWNDLPVTDIFPKHIPDVFSSSPIIVKGRYSHPAEGDIVVSGLLRGKPWSQKVHVVLPAVQREESAAIPSLWAREKMQDLQAQEWMNGLFGESTANLKEQMVNLALDYRLMSQYTSFVAVEEKIVNPGGQQSTSDVPVEMPEGVSHGGIFKRGGAAGTVPAGGAYYTTPGHSLYARRGDPLIRVEAPFDAAQVIALMPGGEIKRLLYNAENDAWEARFDIPTYVADGEYKITVVIVSKKGTRRSLVLSYNVDTNPPTGKGQLQIIPGHSPQLRLALEADEDTHRIVVLLPWGERVPLKRSAAQENLFDTLVKVPQSHLGKPTVVQFILTDKAHNRTTVTVDMSKP